MTPEIKAPSSDRSCYQRSSQSLVFAVSFEFSNGTRSLGPYAYLQTAEMPNPNQLAFHYSFGVVRLTGQNLEDIYDAAQAHELRVVRCGEKVVGLNRVEVASMIWEAHDSGDF